MSKPLIYTCDDFDAECNEIITEMKKAAAKAKRFYRRWAG